MKKLTINTVALGNLRHRKKQYTALIIGVVLAMIFSCGVPFFLSCSFSSQEELRSRYRGKQSMMLLEAQDIDMEALAQEDILDEEPGYLHVLGCGFTEDPERGAPIAYLDEIGQKIYYPQIAEGRFPQKRGEIAIEQNVLFRMGLKNARPGDTIRLHLKPSNGGEYLSKEIPKEYRLVGILQNRKENIEHYIDLPEQKSVVPGALVSSQELIEPGGKENLIALICAPTANGKVFEIIYKYCDFEHRIDAAPVSDYGLFMKVSSSTSLITVISALLGGLSCFGIANAFSANLKERKKQIGMLRAVGATRKQIISVFGREAVLIALISMPASVAAAYLGVKLFSLLMGDYFVFLPSIPVLLGGAAFGFAAIILSALIPLISISRTPPMQAIRDTELMRKMRNKKVRTKTHFQMDQLLSQRKMMFSRGKLIAVIVMLAVSTGILLTSVGSTMQWIKNYRQITHRSDYRVDLNGRILEGSLFLFRPENNDLISESQRREAMELPGIDTVSGQKSAYVNLLVEGEYPEYLTLIAYCGWEGGRRFGYVPLHDVSLTEENLHEVMQAEPNPRYQQIRQWASYFQELYAAPVTALEKNDLENLESCVLEGKINPQKLDSGEEIVLLAPPEIGLSFHKLGSGGYSMNLLDISPQGLKNVQPWMKNALKYVLAEAQCPYHAGDELTLSMLTEGENGEPVRVDRKVRIGAIVGEHTAEMGEKFGIYTTIHGLDLFHPDIGYDALEFTVNGPVTEQTDEEMQQNLLAIFPGKEIHSRFAQKEWDLADFKTNTAIKAMLILTLSVVCISMVNNSISAQIREGKRTIGTLRAVGASRRDITRSYLRQILLMTGVGVLLGIILLYLADLIAYLIFKDILWKIVLWPAPVLFLIIFGLCCWNMHIQVKKISRQSIVQNIREL